MVGSASIRAGRQFAASRKVALVHQHVVVACKGDPRRAAEACGPVQVATSDPLAAGDAVGDVTPGAETRDESADAEGTDA